MMAKNKLGVLREKLRLSNQKYLDRDFLDKLISRFAPSYKISDLVRYGLITVIKRGKYYLNNLSTELANPYKIIDLYFEGKPYMFGGLGVYNMYGFSTQLVDKLTVYNTIFAGEKTIGKNRFIFKKQKPSFFYGIVTKKSGKYTYKVMSPERAFIQMLKEGKRFNRLPSSVKKEKLLKLAQKYAPKYILSEIQKLCLSKK